MQIIKPEEQKVMSLAMLGKTSEAISALTNLPLQQVEDILNSPSVRSMRDDLEISNLSNQLSLTRLRGANGIIDAIIQGAQKIVDEVDSVKWNKNHVELFKIILKEQEKLDKKILDEIQNRINITNNIQINVRSDTQAMEGLLWKLPAKAQASFWEDVIALGNKYTEEYARAWWTDGKMKIVQEL